MIFASTFLLQIISIPSEIGIPIIKEYVTILQSSEPLYFVIGIYLTVMGSDISY